MHVDIAPAPGLSDRSVNLREASPASVSCDRHRDIDGIWSLLEAAGPSDPPQAPSSRSDQ
jgi:hypothetical protein